MPQHYHGLRVWFAIAAEGATEFMLKSGGVGTGWFGYYDTQFLEHASRAALTRQNDYPLTVKNVLLLGGYLKRYYHGHLLCEGAEPAQAADRSLRQGARRGGRAGAADHSAPARRRSRAWMPISGSTCRRALSMINNTPQFNLTGHPAISVPCGVSDDLPIGCQIVGRHFDDLTVLKVADALEKSADWQSV